MFLTRVLGIQPLSTQSWQCWHFCTTSNENKLEMVISGINYNTNLHFYDALN